MKNNDDQREPPASGKRFRHHRISFIALRASLKICALPLNDEYYYSKKYHLQNLISKIISCYRVTVIRQSVMQNFGKKLYSSIVKEKYDKFWENASGPVFLTLQLYAIRIRQRFPRKVFMSHSSSWLVTIRKFAHCGDDPFHSVSSPTQQLAYLVE